MKKQNIQVGYWYCGKSRYVRRVTWMGARYVLWRSHVGKRGRCALRSFCKWAIEDLGMDK